MSIHFPLTRHANKQQKSYSRCNRQRGFTFWLCSCHPHRMCRPGQQPISKPINSADALTHLDYNVLLNHPGTGKPASSVLLHPPSWSHRARRAQRTRSSKIPWSSFTLTMRTGRSRRPWRRRRVTRAGRPSGAFRSRESVSTAPWPSLSWPTTCRPELPLTRPPLIRLPAERAVAKSSS